MKKETPYGLVNKPNSIIFSHASILTCTYAHALQGLLHDTIELKGITLGLGRLSVPLDVM